MFIGLMGVSSDNTLITPSGRKLFRVPAWLARRVQGMQHWIAKRSWRSNKGE